MKTGKKILLILLIIAIIAVTGFGIYKFIENQKINYEIEEISEYKYFLVTNGEKVGVIDTNGNTVIDIEYDDVKIPNPSKGVFVCVNYLENDKEEKVILNEKKEKLFSEYEEVDSIRIEDVVTNLPYEKSILKYKQGDKYGIINLEGKKLTNAEYDEIKGISYKEGELLVKQEEKYGIMNLNGAVIVKCEYDSISSDSYYSNERQYKLSGYIVTNKQDDGYKYGYINYNGKQLLEVKYNEIYRITDIQDDKNAYLIAKENGQYGIIKNKNQILNFEYQSIEYDTINNIFVVEKTNKFGVSNIEGNIIIPVDYEQISVKGTCIYGQKDSIETTFDSTGKKLDNVPYETILPTSNENYEITVDKEGNYGVIDKDGNTLIKNNYTYIEYAFDDYFIVCGKEGKLGLLNSKEEVKIELKYGLVQKIQDTNIIQTLLTENNITEIYSNKIEKVVEIKNAKIDKKDNFIKIYSENQVAYVDYDGQEMTNTIALPNNTLFAKEKNGRWGFVDKQGNIKVEYTYDRVTDFNEYGYAGIKKDDKWGVIKQNGEIILEPTYTFNSTIEPVFIGKYYKIQNGYGEVEYTNKIAE